MQSEPLELVRRKCRFCGKSFKQPRGQAKQRGCPECEPPLLNVPRERSSSNGG